jgi:two-component system LytT family response regulator
MNRLRVAIADDELLARKRLVRLLEEMSDVEVVGVHEDATSLLAQVAVDAIDVIVIDVQMPGLDGLEASALVPAGGPFVVFATAHPEHAARAFDVGAIDYVLKPIDGPRLTRAIDRAREQVGHRRPDAPRGGEPLARLAVGTRHGVVLLDPSEISHAEFDGALVTIHRRVGEPLLSEYSLQDLAQRLPEPKFDRVSRRALVNLAEIAMLVPQDTGGYVAVMNGGAQVPVSRQSARRLRRWLGLGKAGDTGDRE